MSLLFCFRVMVCSGMLNMTCALHSSDSNLNSRDVHPFLLFVYFRTQSCDIQLRFQGAVSQITPHLMSYDMTRPSRPCWWEDILIGGDLVKFDWNFSNSGSAQEKEPVECGEATTMQLSESCS
ncbi:uncharacterized protein LOC135695484 [Rhopilema esculentum]|uniref:uncharacterized protein LOC135695484 n=1 Tax=Rhopilema esculentum TaxID=499914 RepID=UPI0031CF70B6